eukprot:gene23247-28135_t
MAAFSEFVSTAKINIFNAAQPMGGPVQFLSCINAWVPQPETIDLFIMEFAVTSETHLSSAVKHNAPELQIASACTETIALNSCPRKAPVGRTGCSLPEPQLVRNLCG